MLRISRRTVRHSAVLYLGCFVAVAVGVGLLGLAASAIAAGTGYLDHHPGALVVTVTGDGTPPRTAHYRPQEQSPEDLLALLGIVSTLCGFMTVFVVASTFAFVVAMRRRELGLLRLIGATPRQIRRMILGEALIVAVGAAGTGALLAYLATPVLLAVAAGTGFTPVRLDPQSAGWIPLTVAVGIGIATALLGAGLSARRAARVAPVDALREAATEPPRLTVSRVIFGLSGLAGGVAMLALIRPGNLEIAVAVSISVPLVFVIGLVALAPVLVPLATRAWARAFRSLTGVPGHLADRNVWAAPRRTASLAAPILSIATIAGTLSVMMAFMGDLTHAQGVGAARPSLVVTPAGGAGRGTDLSTVPGVRTVDPVRQVEVVRTDRGSAVGTTADVVDPVTFQQARRLDVRAGSLDRLRGDTVGMIESLARDNGYRLGEPVRLSFLDGTAKVLTLVAIVADAPHLVSDLMLPASLVDRHAAAAPQRWIVLPADGVDADRLASDLRRRGGGIRVADMASWLGDRSEEFRRANDQALLLILGPVGCYAGIAIVNTLLIGSLRRRREFVAARLLGATPHQIRQMILYESSLVAVAALSIAGGVTALVAGLARRAMMSGVDPVGTTLPWPTLVVVAVLCAGLAVGAAMVPAVRVIRDAEPSAAAQLE